MVFKCLLLSVFSTIDQYEEVAGIFLYYLVGFVALLLLMLLLMILMLLFSHSIDRYRCIFVDALVISSLSSVSRRLQYFI